MKFEAMTLCGWRTSISCCLLCVFCLGVAWLRAEAVSIEASAKWKPIEFPREVESGSILDFSQLGLQDAPAGRHGFLKADSNGHFVFADAPGRPVRLYGTNLCYMANYLPHADAERLATRLATMGYNAVRFHHYDFAFTSTEANAELLDRLDYLFAQLKQRGIYVMIDLYCTRWLRDGEVRGFEHRTFPPWNGASMSSAKAILLLTDGGFENFKAFAGTLLNHVNPYTGLRWKDDSALALVGLVNEDAVFGVYHYDAEVHKAIDDEFAEACRNGTASTDGFNKFLVDKYNRCYRRMASFLKEELGVRALLTDQNHWQSIHQAPMNAKYDFVDKHMYWSHPNFIGPIEQGFPFDGGDFIKRMGGVPMHGNSASRIFGVPFVASEMNFCFPNAYRAEYGALLGAYAALQDWAGIFQFSYLDNEKAFYADDKADIFQLTTDPIMFLADRLAVLLFLRNDVAASDLRLPITVPKDYVSPGEIYPESYDQAGTVGQIGAVMDETKANAVADAAAFDAARMAAAVCKAASAKGAGVFEPKRGFARSSTGEIEIDGAAGTLRVVTQRSEAFVLPAGKNAHGNVLEINENDGFACFCAAAMDKQPLRNSSRILLMHLTNVYNSGMRFKDETLSFVEKLGTLPHLAAAGAAEVVMHLADGNTPAVYAVDLAGHRVRKISAEWSPETSTLRMHISVLENAAPCLVYEIAR